jgi:hypothetical protein
MSQSNPPHQNSRGKMAARPTQLGVSRSRSPSPKVSPVTSPTKEPLQLTGAETKLLRRLFTEAVAKRKIVKAEPNVTVKEVRVTDAIMTTIDLPGGSAAPEQQVQKTAPVSRKTVARVATSSDSDEEPAFSESDDESLVIAKPSTSQQVASPASKPKVAEPLNVAKAGVSTLDLPVSKETRQNAPQVVQVRVPDKCLLQLTFLDLPGSTPAPSTDKSQDQTSVLPSTFWPKEAVVTPKQVTKNHEAVAKETAEEKKPVDPVKSPGKVMDQVSKWSTKAAEDPSKSPDAGQKKPKESKKPADQVKSPGKVRDQVAKWSTKAAEDVKDPLAKDNKVEPFVKESDKKAAELKDLRAKESGKVKDQVAKWSTKTHDEAKDSLKAADNKVSDVAKESNKVLDKVAKWSNKTTEDANKSVNDTLAKEKKAADAKVDALVKESEKKVDEVKDNLTKESNNLMDKVAKWATKTADDVKDSLVKEKEAADAKSKDLVKESDKKVEEVKAELPKLDTFKDQISKWSAKIAVDAEDSGKAVEDTLAKEKKDLDQEVEDLAKKSDETVSEEKGKLAKSFEKVGADAKGMMDKLSKWSSTKFEEVKDFVKDKTDSLKEDEVELTETAKQDLSAVKEDAAALKLKIVSEEPKDLKEAIKSIVPPLPTLVQVEPTELKTKPDAKEVQLTKEYDPTKPAGIEVKPKELVVVVPAPQVGPTPTLDVAGPTMEAAGQTPVIKCVCGGEIHYSDDTEEESEEEESEEEVTEDEESGERRLQLVLKDVDGSLLVPVYARLEPKDSRRRHKKRKDKKRKNKRFRKWRIGLKSWKLRWGKRSRKNRRKHDDDDDEESGEDTTSLNAKFKKSMKKKMRKMKDKRKARKEKRKAWRKKMALKRKQLAENLDEKVQIQKDNIKDVGARIRNWGKSKPQDQTVEVPVEKKEVKQVKSEVKVRPLTCTRCGSKTDRKCVNVNVNVNV